MSWVKAKTELAVLKLKTYSYFIDNNDENKKLKSTKNISSNKT